MKTVLTLLLFFACQVTTLAQDRDEQAVRQLLEKQNQAWNRGDIEGFMEGYWKNDSLVFVGSRGLTYGWQKTLENYKKGYPDTAAMGKLTFNLLSVKRISADYFSVIGQWHLARTIGDLKGHFTLLVRKIKGKWVVVNDHSS
jgi:uncharacterized protein (TIGR02246 family)